MTKECALQPFRQFSLGKKSGLEAVYLHKKGEIAFHVSYIIALRLLFVIKKFVHVLHKNVILFVSYPIRFHSQLLS